MKKISVAIATFNEQENIGKCLESVSGWADEIVIVDGSSIDKTVDIAKKYHAKIYITDNPPIFHINKQKAIDACSCDWILQLDADEIVSVDLKKEILSVINPQPASPAGRPTTHNPQQIDGYRIPRKNYFLGRFLSKGGQYPDYSLRLYRRGKARLPCKDVHEQAEVDGKVEYLNSPLFHYPYADLNEYLQHFNRYTDIFAREYKEDKLNISLISFMTFIFIKPICWFFLTFLRHKGFIDGFPGFVFSLFSSLRFPVSYIKYWKIKFFKL